MIVISPLLQSDVRPRGKWKNYLQYTCAHKWFKKSRKLSIAVTPGTECQKNNLLFLFHLCMGWMLLAEKWFRKHKPVLTIISHHPSGNPSWWPSHAWYTIRWHQPCTRTDARDQVPAVCDSHVTVTAWQGWTTATYLLFSFWSPLWLNYPPQQHQNSLFLAFIWLS